MSTEPTIEAVTTASITLHFATDRDPGSVLTDILSALPEDLADVLEYTKGEGLKQYTFSFRPGEGRAPRQRAKTLGEVIQGLKAQLSQTDPALEAERFSELFGQLIAAEQDRRDARIEAVDEEPRAEGEQ